MADSSVLPYISAGSEARLLLRCVTASCGISTISPTGLRDLPEASMSWNYERLRREHDVILPMAAHPSSVDSHEQERRQPKT